MEVEEIIQHIFGEEIDIGKVCQEDTSSSSPSSKKSKCLNEVRQWVKVFLDDLGPSESSTSFPTDKRQGRIGPANARFDISTHVGLFVIGADRLSINSQSNFSTIRANVCLYQGKWQYEVQLGSKGVMQIGWATHDCKFSQEIGVGDTSNSYAYDGNRVRKWNVSTHKYGEPWLSGDIIGCTVDLDIGLLEFYRNGRSMGVAFDNIQMGPGVAYFPSVSLAFTENLVANFGSTPLKYPVTGCSPIQDAPFHEVRKADYLCKWLSQLLMLFDRKYEILGQPSSQDDESISNQGFLMGLARIIFNPLAPLIQSPYVSDACFVPFLENLCNLTGFTGHTKSKTLCSKKRRLMLFLDLMWVFFEEHELKKCMENIITCLLAGFRHVPFVLEYPRQKHSLILLTCLCHHSCTRQFLLENVLFDKVRFANFVHVKPLDEAGLAEVVNQTWWDSNEAYPSIEENKTAYFASCQRIRDAISEVETLQVDLLKTLLDNNDGSATQPSSRKIFLSKFRTFLHENLLSSRTLPLLQTPLPITLCCFHRLLVTFRSLWEREVGEYPIVVSARTFYDGSINYHHIDRLGGVLSHLNKTLRTDIIKALGADHPIVASLDTPSNQSQEINEEVDTFIPGPSISLGARFADTPANFMIPVLARMLTQQQQSSGSMLVERMSQRLDKAKGGSVDSVASLIELLDGLVLFYHVAAHKQVAKVSILRESMAEYTGALCNLKTRLDTCMSKIPGLSSESSETEIVKQLQESCEVFEQKLSEQARHMAWIPQQKTNSASTSNPHQIPPQMVNTGKYRTIKQSPASRSAADDENKGLSKYVRVRAAVYSPEKQSHLAWLLRVILQTVKLASQEGELFAFVPDFYLDSLVEICTALRMYMHPTAPIENIEGYEDLLIEVSEFLCDHFSDPRIVHANSKDTLTQALASFVCSPTTLMALERVPYASQMKMVTALLRPYENRAWAQSNWVLVRMWQGCGFAFRYQKSPHLLRKLGPKLLQVDSTIISQSIKPCPSELFQGHVREVMLGDEPLTTQFLNSLLNQLNWAFSEFIGMLQEIQNVSSRPARVFIESRQLKICATCFDLAIALLRVLEMVTSIAPTVFTDESRNSSDLLLARLCQLMCQILNRVSSQAGCFQHVVMLEIPDLETIDHFPILTAVVGILLALLKEEMENFDQHTLKVPKVTKALVMEPSFQLDSLKFVLGNIQRSSSTPKAKPFSFQNYEDDVTPEEIEKVKRMIALLDFYKGKLSEVTMVSEDELCTICYAYSISATFLPCNHHSCRTCIAHHLMNSKDCFFCKAPIETVIDLDGKVLHDLTTNNS